MATDGSGGGTGSASDAKSGRRAYVKPEVKRVPLRPEEAILGFCKSTTGLGPNLGGCTSPTDCSTIGS